MLFIGKLLTLVIRQKLFTFIGYKKSWLKVEKSTLFIKKVQKTLYTEVLLL
jgi:hypothetical protein